MISQESRKLLLRLARESIASGLQGVSPLDAARAVSASPPADTRVHRGAFVTLKEGGELRGCIGSMQGEGELWVTVSEMAQAAAFEDPRFPPIAPDELERVEIDISVLTPFREAASAADFEPGRQGIMIKLKGRSAVFLPQVATEQGWDRETTLDHLSMKAGLPPEAWKDAGTRFFTFEAEVFS